MHPNRLVREQDSDVISMVIPPGLFPTPNDRENIER
jgi:hypothetical protein